MSKHIMSLRAVHDLSSLEAALAEMRDHRGAPWYRREVEAALDNVEKNLPDRIKIYSPYRPLSAVRRAMMAERVVAFAAAHATAEPSPYLVRVRHVRGSVYADSHGDIIAVNPETGLILHGEKRMMGRCILRASIHDPPHPAGYYPVVYGLPMPPCASWHSMVAGMKIVWSPDRAMGRFRWASASKGAFYITPVASEGEVVEADTILPMLTRVRGRAPPSVTTFMVENVTTVRLSTSTSIVVATPTGAYEIRPAENADYYIQHD